MKKLFSVIACFLALSLAGTAYATPSTEKQIKKLEHQISWIQKWINKLNPNKPKHARKINKLEKYLAHKESKLSKLQAKSVPELDAATAPLAALLLGGLLAAGAERRRRSKLA